MSVLTEILENTQQLLINREAEIQRLTKERDELKVITNKTALAYSDLKSLNAELLEALKDAVPCVQECYNLAQKNIEAILKRIRETIAKAEGRDKA